MQVDVEDFEDIKSGYKLTFRFSSGNPFFGEKELVKVLGGHEWDNWVWCRLPFIT